MKRQIALYAFLLLLTAAFFAGCGGDKTDKTENNSGNETVSTNEGSEGNETSESNTETMTETEEAAEETEEEISTRDGVLVHLSEGPADKFRVCMALKIAEEQAAANDVMVYFDQRGTEIAFKETPDFEYNPFPAYKAQIAKLKSLGVKLKVCKPCIDAYFKKSADLMSEVEVAQPGDLTSFTQGRIITLDY